MRELRVFAREWLNMKSRLGEEGNEDMRVSDSENSKVCNCNQNMDEELSAFFYFYGTRQATSKICMKASRVKEI